MQLIPTLSWAAITGLILGVSLVTAQAQDATPAEEEKPKAEAVKAGAPKHRVLVELFTSQG